jgi:hypothetical protein
MAKKTSNTIDAGAPPAPPRKATRTLEISDLWGQFRKTHPPAGDDADLTTPEELRAFRIFLLRFLDGNPDAIDSTEDPQPENANVDITMTGTAANNTSSVSCQLLFDDQAGSAHVQSIGATLTNPMTDHATWQSDTFQLTIPSWRYLFCVKFQHMIPPSVKVLELFLVT